MANLIARARAYAPLAPAERATLRLIEGLVVAAIVAALPIVAQALGRQNVNWGDVARTALAAGLVAAGMALSKYFKAHGDPISGAVATVVDAGAAALAKQAGLSDVGNKPGDLLTDPYKNVYTLGDRLTLPVPVQVTTTTTTAPSVPVAASPTDATLEAPTRL